MGILWTGNPFVDAGIAAILAATETLKPEEVKDEELRKAAERLEQILLSDQSLGINVEDSFARKELSQVFPNSELVNPSNWKGGPEAVRKKFRNALKADLERALLCLKNNGSSTCLLCGRKAPTEGTVAVRKDKVPMLSGMVNFYSAFTAGVTICGVCAFAIRFLPMSITRTGGTGRLWFLHIQSPEIASEISKTYCWAKFELAKSSNSPLKFYNEWQTAGDAGTVLYVLCELLSRAGYQLRNVCLNPMPTTAYIFSNDLRKPFVTAYSIPNKLLKFLAGLQIKGNHFFDRFRRELLRVPKNLDDKDKKGREAFVRDVSLRMLNREKIIALCLDHGNEAEGKTPSLRGGWVAQGLYLLEVLEMLESKLSIIENLGIKIARDDDSRKYIMQLRKSENLYGLFLDFVKKGLITHDQFYTLLPPNDDLRASEIRDMVLGVIYEWQNCRDRGLEFPEVTKNEVILVEDQIIKRIRQIGERLLGSLPSPERWIARLQTARSPAQIRGVYLRAVRDGAIGFNDFVFLVPLEDRGMLWLLRDYLLAFLFEKTAGNGSLPEEVISFEDREELF
ncbi:type I-B CRISPR-associated protein Cas8b1/Cst1 [Thermodesulforhabdus norvegica]|uniref:CRISPR-associated protein Cst1 n=1 Tax=Thermodesulforhabdus norvegica TaxID=39841 RepID=A0A1I4TMZ5_9BACT|nr:type I-B CRISPR-associated protein Cas8b1/Cst1 [Thermodesulforhabdus norvegica]SFM78132.1 CRISPR-associated protein Cst1 [Thermodesulforhabdus norvegica]